MSDTTNLIQAVDQDFGVCWCDGDPTCGSRAEDQEYGLCGSCKTLGHRSLRAPSFSMLEADESPRSGTPK